jgi:FkbM family methyltransferase
MAEPANGNNSYHFERKGWNCLCIEPNPTYYRQGVAAGRKVENVACGATDADDVLFEIFTLAGGTNQGAISSLKRDDRLVQSHAHIISRVEQVPVKVRTLDHVLAQHPEITSIDFVSIDTENTELDVLKGFDINRWKPKLLIIENNFDEPFLGEYLKQFGYVRDKRVQINDFFVPVKPVERYGQFHGELQDGKCVDQTLREYFPDYNYRGVFFDVGAYEPINISNSYHFEKNGWDVHCFEANTQLIPELKGLRKKVYNYAIYDSNADSVTFNVVCGLWGGGSLTAGISAVQLDPKYMKEFGHSIKSVVEIKVPQKTLDTLIEEEIKVDHIDILSIDVEGGELKVLKGLDLEKYKPKVILVEDVFGDKELHEYLVQHGYRLDKAVEYNKYYVPV